MYVHAITEKWLQTTRILVGNNEIIIVTVSQEALRNIFESLFTNNFQHD